jgi:hypothetical protein
MSAKKRFTQGSCDGYSHDLVEHRTTRDVIEMVPTVTRLLESSLGYCAAWYNH